MDATATAALLLGALILGLGVPWLGIRMLAPSLRESVTVANYRGTQVFPGLGVAWLLWAGAAIVGGVMSSALEKSLAAGVLPLLMLAGPLALVAFALGLVDDAYGTRSSRGFRGHLGALKAGRLTTGGMKLFGISLASFIVALVLQPMAPWGTGPLPDAAAAGDVAAVLALALAAGASIALTSNFVNLTDLRPGRALKAYSVLALAGVVSTILGLGTQVDAFAEAGSLRMPALVQAAALAIFALGPVLAVWRLDLAEEGMLGDAGANPMGAVAGLLIVAGLPLWGLLGYLIVMLGLNLASERYSFSRTIEANRVLSWLDGLGRHDIGEIDRPR